MTIHYCSASDQKSRVVAETTQVSFPHLTWQESRMAKEKFYYSTKWEVKMKQMNSVQRTEVMLECEWTAPDPQEESLDLAKSLAQ